MRTKIFPPGYVASLGEVVFCVVMFFCLVLASVYMLRQVRDVPPLPKNLVLESAYIYRGVSQSRNESYLYLTVGLGDDAYNYTIVARSSDIRYLDLNKSRKLWVAIDSERRDPFVWWVYDFDTSVIISRKDIVGWARYSNGGSYLVAIWWAVSSLYFVLIIFRNGVWSRVVAKRKAYENRED
jgi:hypothetical protein